MNTNSTLLLHMLEAPGFFTSHLTDGGYQRSGENYPIRIDLKKTWQDPAILEQTAQNLTNLIKECVGVIGIETGGVPYASLVAHKLHMPLILARKKPKEGETDILTAQIPRNTNGIVLVDDVIATGKTIEQVIHYLKGNGNSDIKLVTVMSYGTDKLLSEKYGITIDSLYQVEDLLDLLPSNYPVAALCEAVQRKQKSLMESILMSQ